MWAIKASNHAEVYFNVRVDRYYWRFTSQPSASLLNMTWKTASSAHLVGRPQVPQADENGRPDLRGVQGKVWRLRRKAAERRGFEIWKGQRGERHHDRSAVTVVAVWRASLVWRPRRGVPSATSSKAWWKTSTTALCSAWTARRITQRRTQYSVRLRPLGCDFKESN